MDRRSWLWRRKSSEKSPSGETESSGSLSSHSERFSDDQTLSNHNIQSPEVTSKPAADDILNDSVNTLSEKLSEALLNIRAKEELVKQHAKVAEEAVSGWEKAETEVLVLKKQNDALTQKNSILEERVGHLDGALKECLRQLRQTREDQEEKIHGAIANRCSEWESKKSELEKQLSELQSQFQNAESDVNLLADVRSKLEAAEKENAALKLKLLSKDEELRLRISEQDLSTSAAETASKQHLDSIKKVAKLEAECRRLKALIKKAMNTNDHQSITTDSQSENGDRMMFMENDTDSQSKHEKTLGRSLIAPSVEIDLMDDFLEMERLAALPEMHSGRKNGSRINGDELNAVKKRATELEDNLKKITAEKLSLEIALDEYQIKLTESDNQLKQTEITLSELKLQLVLADEAKRDAQRQADISNVKINNLAKLLGEAEGKLTQVQDKLSEANESKRLLELQLEDGNLKKEESEFKAKAMEESLEKITSEKQSLEIALDECQIKLMESENQLKQTEIILSDLKMQLILADEAKRDAQKQADVSTVKLNNLKKLLDEAEGKLTQVQDKLNKANESKRELELQLEDGNLKLEESESKAKVMELELKTLRSSISTLQKEVAKEQNHSREAVAKCVTLESEISRMKSNSQLQRSAIIEEFRINQDEELAVAKRKFAECQKTIASLGCQLKSLATMEDFWTESEAPLVVI